MNSVLPKNILTTFFDRSLDYRGLDSKIAIAFNPFFRLAADIATILLRL
ncbi:MAG: hypothetical protein AAFR89_13400 [Cyanobacteria bacterium J06633_1]